MFIVEARDSLRNIKASGKRLKLSMPNMELRVHDDIYREILIARISPRGAFRWGDGSGGIDTRLATAGMWRDAGRGPQRHSEET